jgi:hypothetical protein
MSDLTGIQDERDLHLKLFLAFIIYQTISSFVPREGSRRSDQGVGCSHPSGTTGGVQITLSGRVRR